MRIPSLLASLLMTGAVIAGDATPATPAGPTPACKAFSEAIGVMMAERMKSQGIDVASVAEGLRKGMAGEKPLPQDKFMELQNAFQGEMKAVQDKATASWMATQKPPAEWKAAEKLPASVHDEFYKAFLAIEGVKKTDSGLSYQVIKAAEGAKPKATDTVKVHYVGRHTSGEIFDASYKRGEPTQFPLNGVIKGWTEGLQLMSVGSKYRFVIPGELAYGPLKEGSERPTGTLIFDVELIAIVGQ